MKTKKDVLKIIAKTGGCSGNALIFCGICPFYIPQKAVCGLLKINQKLMRGWAKKKLNKEEVKP